MRPSLGVARYIDDVSKESSIEKDLLALQSKRECDLQSFSKELNDLERDIPQAKEIFKVSENALSANTDLSIELQKHRSTPSSISTFVDGGTHTTLEATLKMNQDKHDEFIKHLAHLEQRRQILKSNIAITKHSITSLGEAASWSRTSVFFKGVEPVLFVPALHNRVGDPAEMEFLESCLDEENTILKAIRQRLVEREREKVKFERQSSVLQGQLVYLYKLRTVFTKVKEVFDEIDIHTAQEMLTRRLTEPYLMSAHMDHQAWMSTIKTAHSRYPATVKQLSNSMKSILANLDALQAMEKVRSRSISRLHSMMDPLKETIRVKSEEMRLLSSAFRRTPVDVWRMIFERCVVEEWARIRRTPDDARMELPRIAIVLSSICQCWRRITFTSPELWRYIVIPSTSHATGRGIHLFQAELAKHNKLEIAVPQHCNIKNLSIISKFPKRGSVERLYLESSDKLFMLELSPRVLHCKKVSGMLCATLMSRTQDLHIEKCQIRLKQSCPLVNTLKICGGEYFETSSISPIIKMLPNLEFLTIHTSLGQSPDSSLLRHDTLYHLNILASTLSDLITTGKIILPQLTRLTLFRFRSGVFPSLEKIGARFPALEHLAFSQSPSAPNDELHSDGLKLFGAFSKLSTLEFEGDSLSLACKMLFRVGERSPMVPKLRISHCYTRGANILEAIATYRLLAQEDEWSVVKKMKIEFVDCPYLDVRFEKRVLGLLEGDS